MRSFELLKKAIEHPMFHAEESDLEAFTIDLLGEMDRQLTTEEWEDEGDSRLDTLMDKLAIELKELDEADDDEEEDDYED